MTTVAKDTASREAQENVVGSEGAPHREERRTSLWTPQMWSRFLNFSQRGGMRASGKGNVANNTVEKSSTEPAAEAAVLGDVVEKSINEESEEKKSPPRLKDEDDVNERDKKPAAVKGDRKEKIAVVPVTMDEAKYSTERMQKALEKLRCFLQPEPAASASGELDSVFESNFKIKDQNSAKAVVKIMRSSSKDLSPEFKLLTVTAFRNACLQNKDLTRELFEVESVGLMIGAKIMDMWNYEAAKNLEHLATTVGSDDDKNWFHEMTASFLVMESLKFIWDSLVTEKKEELQELFDKKKQLELLYEQYGLEWSQNDYLSDTRECGLTIGADAIVRACDTNKSRLARIMSSRFNARACCRSANIPGNPHGTVINLRRHVRSPEETLRERERLFRRVENFRRVDEILAAHRARNDQDAAAMVRVNASRAQPNNEGDLGGPRPNEQLGQGLNRAMLGIDEHIGAMAAEMEAVGDAVARASLAAGAPRNNERPLRDVRAVRNVVSGETLQNVDVDVKNNERSEESNSRAEGARVVAASGNIPGLSGGETLANSNQRSAPSNGRSEAAGGTRSVADVEEPPTMRKDEESAVNNGNLEQQGGVQAAGPRAARDVALEPGRDSRAAANDNSAERRAGDDGRNEEFSATAARAAFPHLVEERRAVLAGALRNERGHGHAFAIERQLEMEEDELLWGSRLPARRRRMLARRAIRDGRLDILHALEDLDDFDAIAHLEAMEHDRFDSVMRSAMQPPRGLARQEPSEPSVPPYLKELRDFEACAKTEPFDITEGLELVKPCPEFDAEAAFIKRVAACVGWAIHGLIFELVDGTRMGTLLVNPGDKPMVLKDKNLADRNCVGWTDVEYGDFIVGMHGDRLTEGTQSWFCYSLVLEFASGRTISYEACHEAWRGEPFSFDVPRAHPCFVYRISFKNDQKEDMLGLVTSIHLPMSRANLPYLPRKQQQAVEEVLEIGRDIDLSLETYGLKPMGEDVWWLILGFIRGWELLPPSPNVKGSKNGQRVFDLYARRHEYRIQS